MLTTPHKNVPIAITFTRTTSKSQDKFLCESCGHTDNADLNATKNIKRRAIQLILNAGTELSKRGVLTSSESGRGDKVRRKRSPRVPLRSVEEASKESGTRHWKLYCFSLEYFFGFSIRDLYHNPKRIIFAKGN